MPEWTRREFSSVGMTQYPVGPYFKQVQALFGGIVYLCIDVSGSMSGDPIKQAIAGGLKFVEEAFDAHYEVGIVLWNDQVHRYLEHTENNTEVERFVRSADIAGGTNIVPTLVLLDQAIGGLSGDRVVAIFGDGDLGNRAGAIEKAAELTAKGVRIISCGLGDGAASALDEISTEGRENPRSAGSVDEVEDTIADMAVQLSVR